VAVFAGGWKAIWHFESMVNGAMMKWIEFVNASDRESELEDLRSSAQRGGPFGSDD
jgi:hypothetical protein